MGRDKASIIYIENNIYIYISLVDIHPPLDINVGGTSMKPRHRNLAQVGVRFWSASVRLRR